MLQLIHISKIFQERYAVQDFNLAIKTGELIVLIGPSGCGKSTILKIIMGLIHPDSGTVELEGEDQILNSSLAFRRKMGYVIQEGGLFPHLTAAKNVTLVAEYLDWAKQRIKDRVLELLELTQLPEETLKRYPTQLSGGQRQRVSLMRALMLDPDLLLFDEPLGALDPLIRADLQQDLKQIFQRLSKTVLMVTHDMAEAAYFGNKIVLMRQGKIVQNGTLSDLIQHPADPFVTRFIKAQRNPLEKYFGN
jgi:osmoprotectant transport system ATP-binding protein